MKIIDLLKFIVSHWALIKGNVRLCYIFSKDSESMRDVVESLAGDIGEKAVLMSLSLNRPKFLDDEAWANICVLAAKSFSEKRFLKDDGAILAPPTVFFQNWLAQHHMDLWRSIVNEISNGKGEVL